ncbi:Eco57I restriction-modification methylase domain-containing protein [Candidatus Chloroploca sp. M-50]|uniref:site-specific DNA-methyltransferase (adenine-specific) n=1 Tax=Candidatus Chloroploca mongolica TaxID=2528176 RepID=A0ABS4DHU5_9CHLR|nr:TaqI-like C-terminal specificity domain-containing protein [Candidatus Chloroploca mongolica]MBP1469014.1 Eco57I restriction-modification methylase domain-containing protein [Candidatus Chloroploca mongolica]
MSLLATIQQHLDAAAQAESLRDLFAQTLGWGRLAGAGQQLRVGAPVQLTLVAQPLAQLGGLPVFRLVWPEAKPPTVMQRRAVYHALAPVAREHLLCYVTQDGRHVAFVWARDRGGQRVELRTLPYEQGSSARTTLERLAVLAFRFDDFDLFGELPTARVLERLNEAFDVEVVTRQFFATYRACFEQAEAALRGIDDAHARRLWVQKLFNRLMFIVFLERKGWLSYAGRTDYLRALWQAHVRERVDDPQANFYTSRLKLLFFAGLNTPHEVNVVAIKRNHVLEERIGRVPYLNGGLFEEEPDDRDDAIVVPDVALEEVLTDLFYRFNFTVSESTPFDIEVAVDPEMLGKVFEELVTGRHESGSYYTPRPIVAFMCREGLKGYLQHQLPHEAPAALAAFVDARGAADLNNPEAVLAALKRVRACDPACGSGAYLLGMLQELLALRAGLFAARKVDPVTTYQRKLEIIQNNIYGVDLDPFAVNIARLRLWLSLVVDYEGDDPPPLPNLDYKVEVGDSLTAPDPSGGLQPDMFRKQQIADLFALKEHYLRAHGSEKATLRAQVAAHEREITAWAHPKGGIQGFDWAVEFAEVFAEGGFDIVVANPPYVRQELIKALKPTLKSIYPDVYVGTADLYVYFYARALQSLRDGGMLCFITPNKWFRAGYGEKLRSLMQQLDLRILIDFGDAPVFQATTYPSIIIASKQAPTAGKQVLALTWASGRPLGEFLEVVEQANQAQMQRSATASGIEQRYLSSSGWNLAGNATYRWLEQMKASGKPLGEYVQGRIYRGLVTGLNDAFVIDGATRDQLIKKHSLSKQILKPWLRGRDVKRWRIESNDLWLCYIGWDTVITDYPAILDHLKQFEAELKTRPEVQQGRYPWYALSRYAADYWQEYEIPKVLIPSIIEKSSFVSDKEGFFSNDKTSICIAEDINFTTAILNSSLSWFYLTQIASSKQGGFYEAKPMYISQIPIPNAPADERKAIGALAKQCLKARGQGAQVAAWEAEIDERVARLYGLSAADLAGLRGE